MKTSQLGKGNWIFRHKKMKTLFSCRFYEERERLGFALEYPRIDEKITLCINDASFPQSVRKYTVK
jgi:hypothetical protein